MRDGWDVTILTTGDTNRIEQDGKITVIRRKPILSAKTKLAYFRIWISLFWTALKLPAPNVVVSMTDPPLLVVAMQVIASLKKSKHIHWCQDLYPDLLPVLNVKSSSWEMGLFRRLSNKALKNCDKIIVIGRCMARKITQKRH